MSETAPALTCTAVSGVGEVRPGSDLAGTLAAATPLRDGDIVVVTSKVVSKAEGRVVQTSRQQAVDAETDRVVARRGQTRIVRTRTGLVMAAAGVDASNVEAGAVVLLPTDPDASARSLREGLARTGANVAVVVSDTAGRAWRTGQTDIAVGAAGIEVLVDYAGTDDGYGNTLVVTAPAVADEVAAAADLVKGKLSRCPAAVVRGLAHLVLPRGEHGVGAARLVRPEREDLFGHGARDAVLVAAGGSIGAAGVRGFGGPASATEVVSAVAAVAPAADARAPATDRVEVALPPPGAALGDRELGRQEARLLSVVAACAWSPSQTRVLPTGAVLLRLSPTRP